MSQLVSAICSLENLHRAYRGVRSHIRSTTWSFLRNELSQWDEAPIQRLQELQQQLQQRRYRFSQKIGYVKRKSGGSRRGVTVLGISDRIVQRSILNVFQSSDRQLRQLLGEIPSVFQSPMSFAGQLKRGVPEAVSQVQSELSKGRCFVAISDVKDFFPCISRQEVVSFVRDNTGDSDLTELFSAALETELSNVDELDGWISLFPTHSVGVAQGSLLSVFAGNVILRKFDQVMNGGEVATIRYLDDFAILGKDRSVVESALATALEELARLGMTCYLPHDGSEKGALVDTERSFEFLGCRIHANGVSPSRKAQRQLLNAVDRRLEEGKRLIHSRLANGERRRAEPACVQILNRLDQLIRGWGDSFAFVTNRVVFSQLDLQIDAKLRAFQHWYRHTSQELSPQALRRAFGVALLGDTPPAW